MVTDLGFVQRLVRFYTFNSPIKKGKYRLANMAIQLKGELPKQVVARTSDGRTLKVNFDNNFAHFIYFIGEYEPAITSLIKSIIKPGDVCFDIGGNIGWFTTLFQTIVGKTGAVHSFEPVPPTFKVLDENVRSNINSGVVRLNNIALGEEVGEVKLYIFDNLPDGHASIYAADQTEYKTYLCRITTIDNYLKENAIKDVKFVKVDIEGSELPMLKGATAFFKQEIPPIFEIEMALNTTKQSGYLPNDIIDFIRSQYSYDFFAINEMTYDLEKFDNFAAEDIGANVLCVPSGHYQNQFRFLGK